MIAVTPMTGLAPSVNIVTSLGVMSAAVTKTGRVMVIAVTMTIARVTIREVQTSRFNRPANSTSKGNLMSKTSNVIAGTAIGGGAIIMIVWIIVVLGILVGWVMNIIEVLTACCEVLDPMMCLRLAGIVLIPLGGVLGWI